MSASGPGEAGSRARSGFDFERISAGDYERTRPGYSREAVEWAAGRVGIHEGATVVDLGSGTGKLARLFVDRGARVIAVEPAGNMRANLQEVLGHGLVVGGTAEAVPLGAASADCVVVGHAFHHFDPQASLREIHRVLRPGGVLALFWIVSDPSDPVDAALDEMVSRHVDPGCPIYRAFHGWQDAFRDSELFTAVGEGRFRGRHDLAAADLPLLWATSSDVASLPREKRRALLAEIAAFAEGLPQRITLPTATGVHLYRRISGNGP